LAWRWRAACAMIVFIAAWAIYSMARPADEVVLTIGEPYEQVRRQSRSTLPPAEPNTTWGDSSLVLQDCASAIPAIVL
jgi:hypothetical protein